MELNRDILRDQWSSEYTEDYKSCLNARGLYDSMQFVLRLRRDLHVLLENVESGIVKIGDYDFETIQAFSTYFHETIHWWQHSGSISGLILSLTYPSQTHINHSELKRHLKLTGPVKSIKKYNKINSRNSHLKKDEFKVINIILNNFHDIEFFKYRVIVPEAAKKFGSDPLFESVGHSFYIAYSSFINLLSSCFDEDLVFLPNAKDWPKEFSKLREAEIEGYYYGSDIAVPPLGLKEIYEGQARFLQIQYLYFASGGKLSWDDFEDMDMLSGIYYKAFSLFLELTESERPESIDSSLVALFLLILDLAMNPTDGFPFEIIHHESFIESVDPGIRFLFLCRMVFLKYPELKNYIKDYSYSEYFEVSQLLSKALVCPSPLDSAALIVEWAENQPSLVELMKEEENFDFGDVNQPIRLIFSRFIRFQQDKLINPEYFCWTGVYSAGAKCSEKSVRLFSEHEALFKDKIDGDIYPRIFPGKEQELVQSTFDKFYSWVATYNLSRQWIIEDGEFSYDFWWLTSKYTMEELETWASYYFELAFGVKPQDFRLVEDD
ncbi:hypothetical protein P8S55_14660 [Halomonas sp. M1]|uniref:hypothetical protein n=1 Tax=Halomonas sp. M1 TaxID=3035470 RepID=UPI00248687D8|nr:hypothetical protein [Halomonas sp. M1]WFE71013.1 hypothetical protein P8S55_14660 [Halomonas sp. M1]